MESLWKKQTKQIETKADMQIPLFETPKWDVIVIGAGMAGLLIAYYLKEQGKKVLILEADEIAFGQTGKTTAKITSQHGLKYSTLIKKAGEEKARLYLRANEAAIREYERLIKTRGIECQFKKVPAYLYTLEEQGEILLKEEAEAAAQLGIDVCFTTETELPFSVKGAVCFQNQAQFSPLEFVENISAGLQIAEHTKVTAVKGNKVITEETVLTADQIVVATHYPFFNIPGFYFLRQHQERGSVLALSGAGELTGMYYGIDPGGLSLRQSGEFLLLGGSAYRTGNNKNGGAYDSLAEAAARYFPGSREAARWSAQDCMPHDGIPFIGKYSVFTPNLYVATGFQKWGMTSSMVAAMVLRDELCAIRNPYEKVFSPQRIQIRAGMGNFLLDAGMSVKGLLSGLFHTTCAQCTHMGCGLVWNPDEKSWDCPCHGSRFDADGKLLDNPAKKSLERSK